LKKLILFLNDLRSSLKTQLLSEDSEISYILIENATEQTGLHYGASVKRANIYELIASLHKENGEKTLRTFIVLPSADILFTELTIPARQFRQVQKALLFLVEDQLASDPDDCFIAVGNRNQDKITAAVIRRDLLTEWRDTFSSLDLYPEKMVADVSLINNNGVTRLDVIDSYALLHLADGKFFSFQLELLPVYLNQMAPVKQAKETIEIIEEADDEHIGTVDELETAEALLPVVEINIYYTSVLDEGISEADLIAPAKALEHSIDESFREFEQKHGLSIKRKFALKERAVLYKEMVAEITARTHHQHVVNLLQGEFKAKRVGTGFKLDVQWKPFAIVTAALIVLYVGSLFFDGIRYKRAAEQAELETQRIFREIFPSTQNFSRMRFRVSTILQESGNAGTTPFLYLFFTFSSAMHDINSKNPNALKLTQIQFDEGTADLRVDILADSFDTLNLLKEKSESLALVLEINSTSTEREGVKGRLRIKVSE
jgi:type II secretion system protein L